MSDSRAVLLGPRYRIDAAPPALDERRRAVRDRLLADDRIDDWEEVDCLCGAEGGRPVTAIDRHGLPYRKLLCDRCGLLRLSPRWTGERYARFYADDYRDLYANGLQGESVRDAVVRIARGPGARLVSAFVERAWERFASSSGRTPTVVEIGAGGGWNLSRLPSAWRRVGYDTDERYLREGERAFGIEMRQGFLDDALDALADADIVLLSHVLEHVGDPVSTLVSLARKMSPHGLLLVEVPGIFRLHKTGMDPMRYWQNAHTYTFCADTAVATCRRAGLEPIAVDEWIRLVLRPSVTVADAPSDSPATAAAVERYLHWCERAHGVATAVAGAPLGGALGRRLVSRGADAVIRGAMGVGLLGAPGGPASGIDGV